MLEQMTSTQLMEWEVMFERWHIGLSPHERADLSAAIIASTVANSVPGRKTSIALEKFLPEFTKPVELTPQQQADALRNRMLSAASKKPRKPIGRDS